MNFDFFTLTEGTITDQSGKIMVGVPILFIALPSFPAVYSFSLVFGATEIDLKIPHEVTVQILDPYEAEMMNQSMALPPNHDVPIKNEAGINSILSSLDLRNFPFPSQGKYTFRISFDGVLKEKKIEVTKLTDPSFFRG